MIRYSAIVEVARHADGAIPTALITSAYRASIAAPVLLVLHDVDVAAIDRILDPLVSKTATPVHGVVYVHATDESRIVRAARETAFAVTTTQALGRLLSSHGLTIVTIDELESTLASRGSAPVTASARSRHALGTNVPTPARA